MRKKIVCIADDFWVDSDEKWGINLFKKNGYEVELWRVGVITCNFSIFETLNFNYIVKTVKGWKEYYSLIMKQKMKNTIFLFYGTYKNLNLSMALIFILGGKYCVIDWVDNNTTKNAILNEKKVKEVEKHWMDYFLPAFSFLGSRHNLLTINSNFQLDYGKNIYLHTYDYDLFLKNEYYQNADRLKNIEQPYILFIDQNFFDHKDQKNFAMKKWIPNETQFLSEIQRFLDEVERQFKLPVLIAAHPVACKRIKEIYGNRKIVYGNTCKYTAYAELVISHSSGALGYAVMYKKPILLYTNYQLERSFFNMQIQMPKARILRARVLNISKELSNKKLTDYITDTEYKEYMEYLTADVNKKELFMETVVRYLKTL